MVTCENRTNEDRNGTTGLRYVKNAQSQVQASMRPMHMQEGTKVDTQKYLRTARQRQRQHWSREEWYL